MIIYKRGRTVVLVSAIVEVLGGTIEWYETARKVTVHFNYRTIGRQITSKGKR